MGCPGLLGVCQTVPQTDLLMDELVALGPAAPRSCLANPQKWGSALTGQGVDSICGDRASTSVYRKREALATLWAGDHACKPLLTDDMTPLGWPMCVYHRTCLRALLSNLN